MKNYLISGAIALVIASAATFMIAHVGPVGPEGPQGKFGALSSPDIPWTYLNWGGVIRPQNSMVMNTGTTTPCSIQSPAATSTLESFSARFDTSTSTTPTYFVAQSKIMTSTTTATTQVATQLITVAGTANEVGRLIDLVATSTSAGVAAGWVFPPNSFINLAIAGGTGTFSPSGECKATWIQN